MNAGSTMERRSTSVLTLALILAAALLLLQAASADAQTPDEACAADSLYLISPEVLDLRLETEGRIGLTVSWPNMDLTQATCFSLKNTEDLNFGVEATGGFGDRVDRVFTFKSPDSGPIGALQPENIIVTWQNEGPSTYGTIGGLINLANNGGIWRYSNSGGWVQSNNQLPMSWRQVNTVGLDQGSGGFLVAGFSRGVTPEANPVGLFTFDGTQWTRIAAELDPDEPNSVVFGSSKLITGVAVSPSSNDMFAVGTARDGLFVTRDGGRNFTQFRSELDPAYPDTNFPDPGVNFRVNALTWSGNRVYVYVNNFGLFVSRNDGTSFERSEILVPETLDSAVSPLVTPTVNSLRVHPDDPDRIAAALDFHGVYESLDGGDTWNDLYGDLLVPDPDPEINGVWVHSALDFIYDEVSPQTIVMGVKQKGLYRTTDGGATWTAVGQSAQPSNLAEILALKIMRQNGSPGTMFVLEDEHSLLYSNDSGATWDHFSSQPIITKGYHILSANDGSGDLIMGSWGGGIYVPGTPLALTETYSTITSPELRDLDLGLSITFSEGEFMARDEFSLVCQTFQGWAVWRGPSHRPEDMTLVGLYDRVNPEDCYEGYCGDMNIEIVPNCFAAKRAACFTQYPAKPAYAETLRFFDEEIYNGFTYNYAVTSFDYGNTALTTPENNSNAMIFSPRFEGDTIDNGGVSPFPGPGNQTMIQINQPLGRDEEGLDEIFVVPNPLRQGAGFPGGEGGMVLFKNIPPGSNILVFTSAGDQIIELLPDRIQAGNLEWDTRNDSGESITSGIYIYKVEIPEEESYWGRLIVIR